MATRSAPRLQDIADRAGVSVTTVSRILNGRHLKDYSEATQQRVQAIAEELDWRPSMVGRGMKTGTTGTTGVLMAPFDAYWTGVVYGVHDTLLERGQVPLMLWPHAGVHPALPPDHRRYPRTGTPDDTARAIAEALQTQQAGGCAGAAPVDAALAEDRLELERINRLEDQRVDALVCWPMHEADARERLARLGARGWRIVLVDDAVDHALADKDPLAEAGAEVRCTSVGIDEDAAAAATVDHLRGLGHRRIGYVGLQRNHTWVRRRRDAVLGRLAQAPVLALGNDTPDTRAAICDFLRAHPDLTAIVGATDRIARHVLAAAARLGIATPERLSVTGYGNDGGATDTPLTTIDQHPYRVGAAAAEASLAADAPPAAVLVEAELIVRGSSAPPPMR